MNVLMGKSSIHDGFLIATFDSWRVNLTSLKKNAVYRYSIHIPMIFTEDIPMKLCEKGKSPFVGRDVPTISINLDKL